MPLPGGFAVAGHRQPVAAGDARPIGEHQRESLYKWANATGWPASVFNAWLQANFGAASIDQIRSWQMADAVIRALRLLHARIEAFRSAGGPG
jgi:hypothetical protein